MVKNMVKNTDKNKTNNTNNKSNNMPNNKLRVLTGITPSGTPHLGNYKGMYQPMIEMANDQKYESFCMISDYHSLIKLWDPKLRSQYIYEGAASWLALGLDPQHSALYLQSDIPQITELAWILTTLTAKGLLNRAHAYKSQLDINLEQQTKDQDAGITAGLYQYPVLMSADILIVNADIVPVGKDQVQHLEIARDIAARFNHVYGESFTLPKVKTNSSSVLIGLDGQKMSKSYGNTIPVFLDEKALRKKIMKIKTNSLTPQEPKDHATCILFSLYSAFSQADEIEAIKLRYANGIGWGEMKQILFEKINSELKPAREYYYQLMNNTDIIDKILAEGAQKVLDLSIPLLKDIKKQVGLILS